MKDLLLTVKDNESHSSTASHHCSWCERIYNHDTQYRRPSNEQMNRWEKQLGRTAALYVCNHCLEELDG